MGKNVILLVTVLLIGIHGMFALEPVDVTDMVFNIGGRKEKSWCYKFAGGDTIILNAIATEGDDISEISVEEWPSSIKFQAVGVQNIDNKKIFVPKTNVYTFKLKNSATFSSKTYQINIQRIPSQEVMSMFNTSVEWDTIYDTTYVAGIDTVLVHVDTIPEEIITTQKKIGSQFSGDTRSYLQISLPEGTTYWAYWMGVGQEAADGLQQMSEYLPEGAAILGIVNPVAAFALGLLPELFTLSQGQDISYYFIADYANLCKFIAGETFYLIKQGKRVITDYSKMDTPTQGTFYLGLDNSHSVMTSKIVTINVVAVKIVPKYEYRETQKPVIRKKVVPQI